MKWQCYHVSVFEEFSIFNSNNSVAVATTTAFATAAASVAVVLLKFNSSYWYHAAYACHDL